MEAGGRGVAREYLAGNGGGLLTTRTVYLPSSKNGKAVPEVSRKLRFPNFMTTAKDGGKVVSLRHRQALPQEMLLVLISVRR